MFVYDKKYTVLVLSESMIFEKLFECKQSLLVIITSQSFNNSFLLCK